jgi:quercetin 2,3-dioxygenase
VPVPEVIASRNELVGGVAVRRALPTKGRRTVGAWCFADHMGPAAVGPDGGLDIGPHPHCGLQTVTWLIEGEVVHRDSLGSEQEIRPGQLNLMTAGHGVSHSEEHTGSYRGDLQGIQLWVALPEATRHGAAAFEHRAELPRVELGDAVATVLVGELVGARSPARADTDHLGAELRLPRGRTDVPVAAAHEHAVVVLDGAVTIDGRRVEPGAIAILEPGREEVHFDADGPAIAMLVGGTPFPYRLAMRWNWVARTVEELDDAQAAWAADDGRFGAVASSLGRISFP